MPASCQRLRIGTIAPSLNVSRDHHYERRDADLPLRGDKRRSASRLLATGCPREAEHPGSWPAESSGGRTGFADGLAASPAAATGLL